LCFEENPAVGVISKRGQEVGVPGVVLDADAVGVKIVPDKKIFLVIQESSVRIVHVIVWLQRPCTGKSLGASLIT
jgi:hypothetical protein